MTNYRIGPHLTKLGMGH